MGDNNNTINFYRVNDEYGCFSNFSLHSIEMKGKVWQTSEHYFQAQKFEGTPFEEQVRATSSPGKAAQLGRNKNLPLRKDWERVKENIMRDVLLAKFTQHDDIKEILLSTGDKTLIEHTVNDSYWGDGGGSGNGKNKLGYLLMEVRDEIRKETKEEIKEEEKEEKKEEEKSSSDNNEEEEGEEEIIEGGIEPNRNHLFEAGATAEKTSTTIKKKSRKGGSKTKSKRGVFRDEDGNSKIEKTNEKKGSVTVIGTATVFSEKALPPQAKNKHQMQRKYHPTEDDFQDEQDDDETTHAKPAPQKRQVADFFKLKENEVQRDLVTQEEMNADECIEAAKNNIQLFNETSGEAELQNEIRENSRKIRNHLARFIEEFAESGDSKLATAMEYFEQLEAIC